MKKSITFIIIIIFIILGLIFVLTPREWQTNLVGPTLIKQITKSQPTSTPYPTPIPTPNAPKTFQFGSSTDLKQELESINPQVLDSDFE